MTRSRELAELASVYDSGGGLGFRNRIINGDCRIDQRNAGASVTPILGTFIVDRWAFLATQTSKATAQQNAAAVTPPTGFQNYLGITSSSAYSVLSSDTFGVYQNVEGFNSADFGWGTANAQTVALSFWVRSSLTGTFSGGVSNSAENRSYVFNYTVSVANTWEQKTVTIPGDTSGTWLTTNGIGLRLRFGLGSGATYTTTSGSWGAGNFVQSTGSISVVGTNGATFYITGVQLEAGTVATSFERRDYGRELMMCQRYYETGYFAMYSYGANAEVFGGTSYFAATKRAVSTITFSGIANVNNSGLTLNTNTVGSFFAHTTGTATARQGLSYSWASSAEL